MEAVPKLPMLYFELKISSVCPDFATPFKRFISKHYAEDGESYDREIHELETLRNNACRAPRDFTGCSLLKRYYSQIYSLQNRFSAFEQSIGVECAWADIYSGQTVIGDLDYELACVLYNIGALHAELGALDMRNNADSMKVACTHFQCAVWAFQHLIDDSRLFKSKDMSHDVLAFFVAVMLAQAQECILEKSMLDNRKSSIVAKVAAQVVEYYSSALLMLLQAALNTNSHTILDIVGSKLYKEWKKFIEFKVAYYNAICALFMGNLSEEQQKMGDRVAWYQSAEDKLNEAIKLGKQLDRSEINEALTFVSDVISVKLGNAKKENDFVYHEKVPTADKLTEVKGVSLVKGISFSVCDPEITGADIFARLVPIEAHETASIYSARKDQIMRDIRVKISDKNQDLASFMSSLQIDKESLRTRTEAIPDELIEVCAQMSVNPEVVNEVTIVLTELEEITDEVERNIKEAKSLIQEEEEKEKQHQEIFGKRPVSMIMVDLSKELSKHEDTHNKALFSNNSLKDNFDRHIDDVNLLISSSARDLLSLLPSMSENVPYDDSNISEMEKLLEKVEEMKTQRQMLETQLKEAMGGDDIMKQVLTHTKEQMDTIFEAEIKKYDPYISLIEQNLAAQENILRALTKANAKYAETRKAFMENQRNRKARIASLIQTYEIFKELQSNSVKGLQFYQKFKTMISQLLIRVKGVVRVQEEERSQFASAHNKKTAKYLSDGTPLLPKTMNTTPSTPKLKDFLPYPVVANSSDKKLNTIPVPELNTFKNIAPISQNYPPVSMLQNDWKYPPTSSYISPSIPEKNAHSSSLASNSSQMQIPSTYAPQQNIYSQQTSSQNQIAATYMQNEWNSHVPTNYVLQNGSQNTHNNVLPTNYAQTEWNSQIPVNASQQQQQQQQQQHQQQQQQQIPAAYLSQNGWNMPLGSMPQNSTDMQMPAHTTHTLSQNTSHIQMPQSYGQSNIYSQQNAMVSQNAYTSQIPTSFQQTSFATNIAQNPYQDQQAVAQQAMYASQPSATFPQNSYSSQTTTTLSQNAFSYNVSPNLPQSSYQTQVSTSVPQYNYAPQMQAHITHDTYTTQPQNQIQPNTYAAHETTALPQNSFPAHIPVATPVSATTTVPQDMYSSHILATGTQNIVSKAQTPAPTNFQMDLLNQFDPLWSLEN